MSKPKKKFTLSETRLINRVAKKIEKAMKQHELLMAFHPCTMKEGRHKGQWAIELTDPPGHNAFYFHVPGRRAGHAVIHSVLNAMRLEFDGK